MGIEKARMVDITEKDVTEREAVAKGMVTMKPATFRLLKEGELAKGDVLAVAQIAGISAAKQTHHLIPLCHPLMLTDVVVEFELNEERSTIEVTAKAKARDKTGVEMEALTAVAVSALTIYDMCKAYDRSIRIDGIRVVRKSGGRSGTIELE